MKKILIILTALAAIKQTHAMDGELRLAGTVMGGVLTTLAVGKLEEQRAYTPRWHAFTSAATGVGIAATTRFALFGCENSTASGLALATGLLGAGYYWKTRTDSRIKNLRTGIDSIKKSAPSTTEEYNASDDIIRKYDQIAFNSEQAQNALKEMRNLRFILKTEEKFPLKELDKNLDIWSIVNDKDLLNRQIEAASKTLERIKSLPNYQSKRAEAEAKKIKNMPTDAYIGHLFGKLFKKYLG